MVRYVIRRLLVAVPVLIGVSLVIFGIMRILPGDIAEITMTGGAASATTSDIEHFRKALGLDRPLHEQYLEWVRGVVTLDFGKSLKSGAPIIQDMALRAPLTLEIALLTVLIAILLGLPTGVLSAVRQDTWIDNITRIISISGVALPVLWTGTIVVLVLSTWFDWIPPLGYESIWQSPWTNLQQVFWPALVLGYNFAAIVSRMTRSCMLEVLRQDYIRTAWSKGLRERVVLYRHALINAMLPVVTIIGVQFGTILGGTLIVEQIFVVPGLGSQLVESVQFRDYPMVQTLILLITGAFVLVNILIDVLYAFMDPRIRYE